MSIKSFRMRIFPTKDQKVWLAKAMGIRRFTWNWCVSEYFAQAQQDHFPTYFDLQKQLNNTLAKDPAYSWLNEITSMVRQESIKDFGLATKAYAQARHAAKRTEEHCDVDKYKPHYQKKGKCADSCRWMNKGNPFKVLSKRHFSLPAGAGNKPLRFRTSESVEFLRNAKFCTCTISLEAGRYYASIAYEKTNRTVPAKQGTIGLDLGIKTACVGYDGSQNFFWDVPQSLLRAEKRTEHINTLFSRTQKGSKRHEKMKLRLQRAYVHEAEIKRDWREKLSTFLTLNYNVIKVDDFSFAGALNLGKTNSHRALYRVGTYAFKDRLKTKISEHGGSLVVVKRFTPTTQTCSRCGNIPEVKLTLKDRVYECKHCGLKIDRDLNAAINVYNY